MRRTAPIIAIALGISAAVPAHAGSGGVKPDGSVIIVGPLVDTFGHRSSNIVLIVPRDGRRFDPFKFRHDTFLVRRDRFFFDDPFRANRTIFLKQRERLFADDAFRTNRAFFRSDADFFRADRMFFRPGHGTIQRFPSQPRFTTGTTRFTTGRLPPFTTQRQGSHRR